MTLGLGNTDLRCNYYFSFRELHIFIAVCIISLPADLPVVYDHNNPSGDVEGVAKVIERDEYKVRKKPKGRAKFIGQSKVRCASVCVCVCVCVCVLKCYSRESVLVLASQQPSVC